jgi:hypothetical protein
MKPWNGAMPQPAATMTMGTSASRRRRRQQKSDPIKNAGTQRSYDGEARTGRLGQAEEGGLDKEPGGLAGLQAADVSTAHAVVVRARLGLGLGQGHRQLHPALLELWWWPTSQR